MIQRIINIIVLLGVLLLCQSCSIFYFLYIKNTTKQPLIVNYKIDTLKNSDDRTLFFPYPGERILFPDSIDYKFSNLSPEEKFFYLNTKNDFYQREIKPYKGSFFDTISLTSKTVLEPYDSICVAMWSGFDTEIPILRAKLSISNFRGDTIESFQIFRYFNNHNLIIDSVYTLESFYIDVPSYGRKNKFQYLKKGNKEYFNVIYKEKAYKEYEYDKSKNTITIKHQWYPIRYEKEFFTNFVVDSVHVLSRKGKYIKTKLNN